MTRSTSSVAACRSSASERCPCASASSRVRASSCFFNSISELGPLLTCALPFVPVERGLRSRVGLFAPLRDKVTSSAQPLVPSGQPSLSLLTRPRDELAAFHSITSSARASSVAGTSEGGAPLQLDQVRKVADPYCTSGDHGRAQRRARLV